MVSPVLTSFVAVFFFCESWFQGVRNVQFFLDNFWVGEILRSVDELLVQAVSVLGVV